MSLFFGRKSTFEPDPTDKILPLFFFEKSALLQRSNVAISLVVDEVLDPAVFGHPWRMWLSDRDGEDSRVKSGELEWHIPTKFTPGREIVGFTHVDYGMPASSHPSASLIPKASNVPAVVGDTDKMLDLVFEPGYSPGGVSDYVDSDRPLTSARVNTFTDKTYVVLYWCHMAFDTMGIKYLMEAWMNSLWGRLDEIPLPFGIDENDPFDVLDKGTRPLKEKHVLEDRRLSAFGLAKWGFSYGVDMLLRAKERRAICVPQSAWQPQYEKAMQELTSRGEDVSKVFLTENDIITAGLIRCIVFSKQLRPETTVGLSLGMSLRKAFEGDLLPPKEANRPYLGNAFGWGNVFVTAGEVCEKPLSWVAKQVRRAINEQGTREQHEAYCAMLRNSKTGLPVVIMGDSNMTAIGMSNWSKANLMMLDFAPARKLPADDHDHLKTPCYPSYGQENHGPVSSADTFLVLGKDCKGNYWLSACKVKGEWPAFSSQLCRAFGVEE